MRLTIWALCLLTFSLSSMANITVNDFKVIPSKSTAKVRLYFSGLIQDYPELEFNENVITIKIPKAKIVKAQTKNIKLVSSEIDTKVSLLQKKLSVALVTKLPFNVTSKKEKVFLTIKDKYIDLMIPKMKAQSRFLPKTAKTATKSKSITKEILNDSYLKDLENEVINESQKSEKEQESPIRASKRKPFVEKSNSDKSSFSMLQYGGKFIAFLGLVLLLFYVVVTIMRKGFISKGKLGFLNKTDQVRVLSQTYLSPKKSFVLVQAHNQVFLVGNTESGLNLISEINEPVGLLKEGERIISGNNFDMDVTIANNKEEDELNVRLKENIAESNRSSAASSYSEVREKVKFSDQIKARLKDLKQLQ